MPETDKTDRRLHLVEILTGIVENITYSGQDRIRAAELLAKILGYI